MKDKIILIGPNTGDKYSFYGGGIGGYTRNMTLYLKEFQFEQIKLLPFFISSRKRNEIFIFSFPVRFIKDISRFFFKLLCTNNVKAVHILGQYRSAIPREIALVIICKLFGIPVIYEIKAGEFISFTSSNKIKFLFVKSIIKLSDLILCEGKIYIDFIRDKFNKPSFYFPNVISNSEIPPFREVKIGNPIRILFVGYCYEGKGVYDLVNAVNMDHCNFNINLEIIGAEDTEFSSWLNGLTIFENLKIIRHGNRDHDFVLQRMKHNDIYCYPTKHPGEGHNNTINEALMNNLVIIATKAGFLGDVLSGCAFFIEDHEDPVIKIREHIFSIISQPDLVNTYVRKGREKIEKIFNSNVQKDVLLTSYNKILF